MKKEDTKTNRPPKRRLEKDTIETIYDDFVRKNVPLNKGMDFSVVSVHLKKDEKAAVYDLKPVQRKLFSMAEGGCMCIRIRSEKNFEQIREMFSCFNNIKISLKDGREIDWLSTSLHKTEDNHEFCILVDMWWKDIAFNGFTQLCMQIIIGNERTVIEYNDIQICCAEYKVAGKKGTLSFIDTACGKNEQSRSHKCFDKTNVSSINVFFKCCIRTDKVRTCEVEYVYTNETGKEVKVSVQKAEPGQTGGRTVFLDQVQLSEWIPGRYDVSVRFLGEQVACGHFIVNENGQKAANAAAKVNIPVKKCAALEKLDAMVGLTEVKQVIRRNTNFMKLMSLRHRAGLPTTGRIMNMILCGGPGTGKTTVARLIGEILADIGILSKGHLCECNRESLIDNVVGGTEKKTMEIIEKSAGGVLFIDEAYSLMDGGPGSNDFGQRVIDTLMPVLTDNNDRIVILAGYEKEIKKLLRTNPGLASRFPVYMHFPDYTIDELAQMVNIYFAVNEYLVGDQAAERIHKVLEKAVSIQTFGAGRFVHTFIENIILPAMATRLVENMGGSSLSKQKMKTILPQDIPEPEAVLAQMGLEQPSSSKIGFR